MIQEDGQHTNIINITINQDQYDHCKKLLDYSCSNFMLQDAKCFYLSRLNSQTLHTIPMSNHILF